MGASTGLPGTRAQHCRHGLAGPAGSQAEFEGRVKRLSPGEGGGSCSPAAPGKGAQAEPEQSRRVVGGPGQPGGTGRAWLRGPLTSASPGVAVELGQTCPLLATPAPAPSPDKTARAPVSLDLGPPALPHSHTLHGSLLPSTATWQGAGPHGSGRKRPLPAHRPQSRSLGAGINEATVWWPNSWRRREPAGCPTAGHFGRGWDPGPAAKLQPSGSLGALGTPPPPLGHPLRRPPHSGQLGQQGPWCRVQNLGASVLPSGKWGSQGQDRMLPEARREQPPLPGVGASHTRPLLCLGPSVPSALKGKEPASDALALGPPPTWDSPGRPPPRKHPPPTLAASPPPWLGAAPKLKSLLCFFPLPGALQACTHPWVCGGAVNSGGPPVATSGDPRPGAGEGAGGGGMSLRIARPAPALRTRTRTRAQQPPTPSPAQEAALSPPGLRPAAATLEVIFDPKGAPYRSARAAADNGPWTLRPPRSKFHVRFPPRIARAPDPQGEKGASWGEGRAPLGAPPTRPRTQR